MAAQINSGDTGHAARSGRARNLALAYVYDKTHVPLLARRLTEGNVTLNQLLWTIWKRSVLIARSIKKLRQAGTGHPSRQDIIKPETEHRAKRTFKNASVVLLDHCGHYGWPDVRAQYFASIDSFLRA